MQVMTIHQPENTYWLFLPIDRCLHYGDGRNVKVGETLTVEGQLKLYRNGFHASKQAINALKYAPGSIACLVTLGGNIMHSDGDNCKTVGQKCKCLWIHDATRLLRRFTSTIATKKRETARETKPPYKMTNARRYKHRKEAQYEWETASAAVQAVQTAVQKAAQSAAHTATLAGCAEARDSAWDAAEAETKSTLNEMLTNMLLAEYAKETTPCKQ